MPTYTDITILLITGSTVFCLALALTGALRRRRSGTIPPVPLFPGSNFPGFFSQFYTAFVIITFAMASIESLQTPETEQPDVFSLIINGFIQIALYLPFLIIYFTLPGRGLPRMRVLDCLSWMVAGLFLMFIPALILDSAGFTQYLVRETGCPENQDVVETLMSGSPGVKVVMLVMAVIVAPVTEECCFRGFVYNILKQYSSPILAAFASALLFSAVHASLAQFVQLFIFGLVQCLLYEKTRSLLIPIILHMLFNAISSVFLLTM